MINNDASFGEFQKALLSLITLGETGAFHTVPCFSRRDTERERDGNKSLTNNSSLRVITAFNRHY